jgi:hypothetical protein
VLIFGALALNWLYVAVVHGLLSGSQSALAKTLVYFAQASLIVLSPDVVNVWLVTALSVVQSVSAGVGHCLYPRSVYGKFVQALVVPLISAAQLAVVVGLVFAVGAVVAACRRRKQQALGDTEEDGAPVVPSPGRERWVVRPALSLLLAVYAPVTAAVLDVLNCRTVSVGMGLSVRVLVSAPAHLCGSPAYDAMFRAAVPLLILVVLGLPLAAVAAVFAARRAARAPPTADQSAVVLGGPTAHVAALLCECYRPHLWWWEAVALLRRAALLLAALVPPEPARRYALAMVSAAALGSHLAARPLRSGFENTVELVAHLGVAFLAFSHASALYDDAPVPMAWALTAALAVPLVVVAGAVLWGRRALAMRLWFAIRRRCSARKRPAPLLGERQP